MSELHAKTFIMNPWRVAHNFTEGMDNEPVVWFEKDYVAARDGEDGHTGHSEIETHLHVIKQAIENPNEVRQDKDYPKRKCYYSWFSGGRGFPNHHMKVVLESTWYGKIRVVTAYFTLDLDTREQTIWTKA